MITYTYQWRHNGTNITGATSKFYEVPVEYLDEHIDCLVTATNAMGSYSIDAIDTEHIEEPLNGSLWSWGYNDNGSLGHNDVIKKSSPIQIGTGTDWKYISNGYYDPTQYYDAYTHAIKTDGTLWGWGYNEHGQLGHNDVIKKSSPVQVGSLTDWKYIADGLLVNAAIKTDGTLWNWGYGIDGCLGDSTTVSKSSPIQIGTDTNWKYVSVSNSGATLLIKTDGTLWAWGKNVYGNLGDGTTVSKSSPVQVGSLTDWKKICSGYVSFAIKTDGTLWGWGYGGGGYFGDGTTVSKSSPIQIGTKNDWLNVHISYTHVVALKTDNTLWTWGVNTYGQLGDGTTVSKSSPIQIGTGTDWKKIGCNTSTTIAIKTDGTLWSWGWNANGDLGDSTTVPKSSPVQIGLSNNWKIVSGGFASNFAIKLLNTLTYIIIPSISGVAEVGNVLYCSPGSWVQV